MQVGDSLVLAGPLSGTQASGYGTARFPEGTTVRVTRVYNDTLWVRGETINEWPLYGKERTIVITHDRWNELLLESDPNAPRPRRLGEVPDGMISPDDPGLKWLWEDAAKVADQRNYCSQYDVVCNALGIPGRPRNRKVSVTVGKVKMMGTFMASSIKEAQELFRKELTESGILVEDGAAMEVVDA